MKPTLRRTKGQTFAVDLDGKLVGYVSLTASGWEALNRLGHPIGTAGVKKEAVSIVVDFQKEISS